MQLAICNPAWRENRNISHVLLRAAVPIGFATAGFKPAASQEHSKSTNDRTALTMETRPRRSGVAPNASMFWRFLCETDLSFLLRILPTSAFQNCSEHASFLTFWNANRIFATVMQIEFLLPSGAHFADRSSKNARPSSRYSPAHVLSVISLNPLPSFLDPTSHVLPRITQGFAPKLLLPVNSLVPDLSPGFVNCLPWNWVDAKHQKVRTLKWFAATGRNLSTCSKWKNDQPTLITTNSVMSNNYRFTRWFAKWPFMVLLHLKQWLLISIVSCSAVCRPLFFLKMWKKFPRNSLFFARVVFASDDSIGFLEKWLDQTMPITSN